MGFVIPHQTNAGLKKRAVRTWSIWI